MHLIHFKNLLKLLHLFSLHNLKDQIIFNNYHPKYIILIFIQTILIIIFIIQFY